jgi:hypothetical protein
MKGRLYKPTKKSSLSQKQLKSRSKPWKETQKVPLIYFWRSSLPENFKSDKSRIFRHVSETKHSKNTEEFLKKNQKYIEIIADSHRHTPSVRASMLNSRESSSEDLEKYPGLLLPLKVGNDEPVPVENEFRVVAKLNFSSFKPENQKTQALENPKRLLLRRASLPKLFESSDKKIPNHLKSPRILTLNTKRDAPSNSLINPRIKYSLNLPKSKKRGSIS